MPPCKSSRPDDSEKVLLFGLAVFKVELLAAEVGSKFKKKNDGKAASKKKTRPQFLDFGPEIESADGNHTY